MRTLPQLLLPVLCLSTGARLCAQSHDTTPPTAPPALTCVSDTPGATLLNWGAATDDTGVTSYNLYRDGTRLGPTVTALTFTDTTTLAGHSYRYTVTAVDAAANESIPSNGMYATLAPGAPLPAFPGAEGFGARITGGRGGEVVYVTNLNANGPGSFLAAMSIPRTRYVLFKVSGVAAPSPRWDDNHNVREGEVTVAGQTSPAGVILRGLYSAGGYGSGPGARNNMVLRHLRSRDGVDQDNLRLMDSSNVIVDHCSFAWAGDECAQVGATFNHTVQHCIFAETRGAHWDRGGILIKYSSPGHPLDNISFHHNLLYRIGGRLPQIDSDDGLSERSETPDTIDIESSHNLLWDTGSDIYSKHSYLNPSGQDYKARFRLNYINNYAHVRSTFPYGMFGVQFGTADQIYYGGNRINIHPAFLDLQLVFCCNNFQINGPNSSIPTTAVFTPHSFPPLSGGITGDALIEASAANVGAFPRDPMDRRFAQRIRSRDINLLHQAKPEADDAFTLDWLTPPPPPLDSDDDGMPDAWELHNGLNPLAQDHTGKTLSISYTGREGYDNLECYLNRLSDHLVSGVPLTEGAAPIYPVAITASTATPATIVQGTATLVTFTITPADPGNVAQVELALDHLTAPYAFPSPASVDITAQRSGNSWTHTLTVPAGRDPGDYQALAHVIDSSGRHGYSLIPVVVTPESVAPSRPTSLAATAPSANSVRLTWTAATDNGTIWGYRIYRDAGADPIATSATTVYTDSTAARSTTYTYTVVAVDTAGNASLPSNPVEVTTPAQGPNLLYVSTPAELVAALTTANANPTTGYTIHLAGGTYRLTSRLPTITTDSLTLQGPRTGSPAILDANDLVDSSGRPSGQILVIEGSQLLVSDLHFANARDYAILIHLGADHGRIEGCTFANPNVPLPTTAAIYGQSCASWTVTGNSFSSIAGTTGTAQAAVRFDNASSDTVVAQNGFIDCDRAIAFGNGTPSTHTGGRIRNNFIADSRAPGGHPGPAITLDTAPGAQVDNNTIYLAGTYAYAILYRYPGTSGVAIRNNLTNKLITAQSGATATLGHNLTTAQASWFVDPAAGDLHLASARPDVVDAGQSILDLTTDIDGTARPTGAGFDIGASEFTSTSAAVYATWRSAHFAGADLANEAISGPLADPDSSGVKNLVRYACDLAARGPVAAPVTLGTTATAAGRVLTLTFPRRAAATNLSYILEASDDLTTWTPVPGRTYTAGSGPITAQDSVALGSAMRRFLRVRMTQP